MAEHGDRLPGLHALRVGAAVGVFIGHAIFWTAHWAPVNTTAIGVAPALTLGLQLFFVVSAFSLMHSTRLYDTEPNWTTTFYLKRFWRIAPLFYVMMVVDGLYSYYNAGRTTSPLEVILNALFINNLTPQYTSSIVYTGWSVSVEMLFYSIFPLIFIHINTLKRGIAFAIGTIIVSQSSRIYFDTIPQDMGAKYGDWCVVVQMQYFALGTLAYLVYERLRHTRLSAPAPLINSLLRHAMFGVPILVIAAATAHFNEDLKALLRFDLTMCGVVFALMTVWLSVLRIPALNWAPIQYFGERSYSLYLLHLPIIFVLKPAITYMHQIFDPLLGGWAMIPVLVITYIPIMVASIFTYAWIEKPGMTLGRQLRLKYAARAKPQRAGLPT